jgi:hypothetical protein
MPAKKLPISADHVYKLARRGNYNTEIAAFFDCSVDTIERRFAGELKRGRAERNINLREKQLVVAEQGSAQMLIWLGKQYLGQTDSLIDQHLLSAIQENGYSKDDLLALIENKKFIEAKRPKVSFEEFCNNAGYPVPFPKQLEMLEFGMNESEPRLLLGARGFGKSDYVTILGVAYEVYLKGLESTNLIITKSKSRNAGIMLEIAEALIKNGVILEMQNSTCIRLPGLVGKDHTVEAITIKTSMRGRHPKRIICDDIVSDEDTSEAMRILVKKKYTEAYNLCKNIILIGQPSHAYDLYAELRPQLKKMEVPWGAIPELSADIEAMKLAGIDEASIEMNYHLRILKTGANPFDSIKYMDQFPLGDSSVAWIDPSFKGTDYTAISIIKSHFQGIAVVGFTYKKSWNNALDQLVEKLLKYNVKKLAFECNSLGDQPVIMLRQLLKGKGIGVVGVDSTMNKHSKIMAAGSYAHLIHLSKESDQNYINQVVQYEYNAKHDDSPDSLASCMSFIGLIRGAR